MLRNIYSKGKAKEAITEILKQRQEEEAAFLKGQLEALSQDETHPH
jgi:hypothetical protein